MASDLLSIVIGSGRLNYVCSRHSVFLFAEKSRGQFFGLSEDEQIEIFSRFFKCYWPLYFGRGKNKTDF